MKRKTQTNRRGFLKQTGAAAGASLAFSAPSIVPRSVLAQTPPSEKLNVGFIGLGWRGIQLMQGAMRNDNIHISAICDLDLPFLLHARQILDDHYVVDREEIVGRGGGMKRAENPENAVDTYLDYRHMIERDDLDGILIAVPDHWHAKTYNDSMKAGKDVYGEKPLSLTIQQGRAIADCAQKEGRIFQTGSQQRSADEFWKACSYARSGRIGKISHVTVGIGGAPQTEPVPNEPVPPGLNWDMWLGPAPYYEYNPLRMHVTFRWFFDYSGGMVTDWGAHHLDIAQWGLGQDLSGPVKVEGYGNTKPGFYTTFTEFQFKFTYDDGVTVDFGNGFRGGVTFHGEKGEIWCNRGQLESTIEGLFDEPLTDGDVQLYKSNNHMQDWVDCVKTRTQPICNPEIGHRSATVCHLANICGWEGRPLEWDPVSETFPGDPAANKHLDRDPRFPWSYL